MLMQRSQKQKVTCMFHLHNIPNTDKSSVTESSLVLAKVWRKKRMGKGNLDFMENRNVVELSSGNGCTTMSISKKHLILYFVRIIFYGI